MVMEAAPAAPFEVIETKLVLQFLIVSLDAPAQMGQSSEVGEGRRGGQGGEVVLRRRRFVQRPLAQEPLDGAEGDPEPGGGGLDPEGHEARPHGGPRAFAPGDGGPGRGGEPAHQGRESDRGLAHCAAQRVGGRPRWERRRGGRGVYPGGHTTVSSRTPSTYGMCCAVSAARNSRVPPYAASATTGARGAPSRCRAWIHANAICLSFAKPRPATRGFEFGSAAWLRGEQTVRKEERIASCRAPREALAR